MKAPIRISMAVPAAPAASIVYASPATGPHGGSTAVRLYGAKYQTGATVTANGQPATSVVVVSPTTITCVLPPGSVGAAALVVTNPDGSTASSSTAFTYT